MVLFVVMRKFAVVVMLGFVLVVICSLFVVSGESG